MNIWNKFKNSEFLSNSELLKLKVTIVMCFVLIFSLLTIPVSIFENFSLEITILIPLGFIVLFIISVIMIAINKSRLAMHFSIYTFFGLTVYYVSGANQVFGYLFLYVTLIVIIFYQDIYTYIIYGGTVVAYGMYYILSHGDELLIGNGSTLLISNLVFQSVLIGFYLVYLINFILSDSYNETINIKQLEIIQYLNNYRTHGLKYLEEMKDKTGEKQIYQDTKFQQATSEIAVFINDFLEEKGENIIEVVEFYYALHDYELDSILSNTKVNAITKSYAQKLYILLSNKNSTLIQKLYEMYASKYDKTKQQKNRYNYNIDVLLSNKINQLIALSMMYMYLRKEKTQFDKWHRIEKSLSHEEICSLFQSKVFREFITFEDMVFFLKHQDIFDEYLR